MTNRPPKQKMDNVPSILLSKPENDALFDCVGRNCCTLATGVVQLFLAETPSPQKWTRKHCGVVCFTKDNPKRCFFIRLYDMKKKQLLWEQELYAQFVYKTPREYFHTFEADNCQAALNFASEDEAAIFKKIIEGKLLERQRKRLEKKQKKQQTGGPASPPPRANVAPPTVKPASGPPLASHAVSTNRPAPAAPAATSSKDKDKGKKKKLTKDDISTPTDFRHISHVGWDPNKGLDMEKLDPEMKSLFETIGIDDQSQVDEETMDFIYDFVDQHGGLEAVKKDLANIKLPVPAPSLPHAQTTTHAPAYTPPPPPTRHTGGPPPPPARVGVAPPPRPGRVGMALPPPPPPGGAAPRQHMAGPPPPPLNTRQAAPPPPCNTNAPAPPPPPPPPAAPMAPPPPAMSGPPVGGGPPHPPVDSSRGNLLNQIHIGSTLKPVETNASQNSGSGRSGLLDQIRSGTSLKKVDHTDAPPASGSQGIVGALAQALAMRKNVIQGSDDDADSDDDMDDDSDEWSE